MVFADSSELCTGIVIIGLGLSLVLSLSQKRQDNRPQHLIYVQLRDQISVYTVLRSKHLYLLRDLADAQKPMFAP